MKTSIISPARLLLLLTGMLLLFPTAGAIVAADFQGAVLTLRKVEEANAQQPDPAEKPNEHAKLRQALTEFGKSVADLSPADAARGWMELVDRRARLSSQSGRRFDPSSEPVQAPELLAALPPSAAWDELSRAVAARPAGKGGNEVREIGLRLLVATLRGDGEARAREIAALQSQAEKADEETLYFFRSLLEQLSEAILSRLDDPDAVLKSLERGLTSDPDRGGQQIRIPNLISLVGVQKTEAFLRRALQHEHVKLTLDEQNETSRLAQKLALEMIDQLKQPQWGLIHSLDSIELYEAMDKRFSREKEKQPAVPGPGLPELPDLSALGGLDRDYEKMQAQTYYLLGLISKGRSADAIAVAEKLGKHAHVYLPDDAIKAMERAGYTRALDDFFYELLSRDPALPFWNEYVRLAAHARQTDRMLTLARAAAARDDLKKDKKTVIHQTLFRALLAADQVEEGIQEIRRLLNRGADESSRDPQAAGLLGITMARVGVLLKKPEWIEEGIQAARQSFGKTEEQPYADEWIASPLAGILLDQNRGPEAEAILTEALIAKVRAGQGQPPHHYGRQGGGLRPILAALATLYHKAGRSADVVALLDQAPYWGSKDLLEVADTESPWAMMGRHRGPASKEGPPLHLIAASSLARTDRREEALKMINSLLDREPGLDSAYALLIELSGDAALARLDELFLRDPFEERPLIWKAELLRRANKLEEAERAARQAISIDPSDGEQGPGDRMRAYAVLAEIREARGDRKEADFCRQAVSAIRLSEEADKYSEAGLLKPAVQMYDDSLKLFADAYCIQSRMAILLAEMGRHEEAEAHYRRAYELMPDSFGRVESHCFGCERAFEGERAQTMAEKIFKEFAAKTPEKPQVHYLLGYLHNEQGRHAEALPHFQTAVRLDPDYLNAWQKIAEISEAVRLPAKEYDRVVFNLLRLDPLQRHVRPRFEKVNDLTALWDAVSAAESRRPAAPSSFYPLAASKAALEMEPQNPRRREMYGRGYDESRAISPGQVIGRNPFVRAAAEMFAGNQAWLFD
jgi:tetratricopeptide (TPR) repeat protein